MFLKSLAHNIRYTIWKWRKCKSPDEIIKQTKHALRVHRNLKKEHYVEEESGSEPQKHLWNVYLADHELYLGE